MGGTAIADALPVRPICGLGVVLPTEIDRIRSGSVLISGADGPRTIHSTAATSVVSLSCSQPQHFEHPTQKLPEIDSHGRSLVVPPPEWAAGGLPYMSQRAKNPLYLIVVFNYFSYDGGIYCSHPTRSC